MGKVILLEQAWAIWVGLGLPSLSRSHYSPSYGQLGGRMELPKFNVKSQEAIKFEECFPSLFQIRTPKCETPLKM